MDPIFEKCRIQKSKRHNEKCDEIDVFNDQMYSAGLIKKKEELNAALISSNALLIVAPKGEVEVWAENIRSLAQPRLCVYTDTLAKRRKIGAHSWAQYDVVITTFDVSMHLSAVICDVI